MGCNPNISHLKLDYNPFTNHLLTSWDIQVYPLFKGYPLIWQRGWNHQLVTDDFGGLFPSLFSQGKLFGSSNPFDWMELISLQGKTNFFEKRVTWDLTKKQREEGKTFRLHSGGTAIFVGYTTRVKNTLCLCCFFVGPMMADSLQIDLDLQICRWCTSNHTRTDHDLDPLQHEPYEHHLLYLFVTWSEGSRANKLRSREVAKIHPYCWWKKSCSSWIPVDMENIPWFTGSFIHIPRVCGGISSINSITEHVFFYIFLNTNLGYHDDTTSGQKEWHLYLQDHLNNIQAIYKYLLPLFGVALCFQAHFLINPRKNNTLMKL